jgi:hypothetical protein
MQAVAIVPAPAGAFDAANDAWERGDYIAALNGYIQLLGAPGGEKFLEPIALTTGELFETRELTGDGRAPRFSPDGRFIVYETGLETSRRTTILRNDATRAHVADLRGVSATFSPPMAQVAYLRIPDHEEIRRASEALAAASLTARNRTQLAQTVTWLIAKHSAIVVRDLGTGREMELPAPDLLKTGLTFSADGRLLYFLGGTESEPDRTDIYVISEGAPRPAIVAPANGLKGVPIVDPSGRVLLYVIPTVSPLRRPVVAAEDGGQTGVRTGVRPQSDPIVGPVEKRPSSVACGSCASHPGRRARPPVDDVRDRRSDGAQGVGCRRHGAGVVERREDAGLHRAVRSGIQPDGRSHERIAGRNQADAGPSRCACAVAGRKAHRLPGDGARRLGTLHRRSHRHRRAAADAGDPTRSAPALHHAGPAACRHG